MKKSKKQTAFEALQLEHVAIDLLKPHPRNYRGHPDDELAHIIESIRQHGIYRNVIVAQDNVLLAGHGVVEGARRIGYQVIPVRRLPIAHDSPAALKVLAGDNEIGHLAEIDDRMLSEILKEINTLDVGGLLGTGFDADLLKALAVKAGIEPEPVKDALPQIDRAEELNRKWKVKRGDLWGMGRYVYCPKCKKEHCVD